MCYFREEILTKAKALVEDTKALVPAAQSSQDVLANAAQSAVGSINQLSDVVKLGAAALGPDDTNAQVNINIILKLEKIAAFYVGIKVFSCHFLS